MVCRQCEVVYRRLQSDQDEKFINSRWSVARVSRLETFVACL